MTATLPTLLLVSLNVNMNFELVACDSHCIVVIRQCCACGIQVQSLHAQLFVGIHYLQLVECYCTCY